MGTPRTSLPRRFALLSALNTASNLTVPLAGLADTVMLGRLDDVRFLAGVVLAALIFDYLYFGCAFLRMSTTGLTAQACGREDAGEVSAHLYRALLLAAALGLAAIALRDPLGDAGFGLLSGTAGVEEAGRRYYDARIWGAPAAFANLALVGWFLGRGEAARALLLVVLANLGNIALNWWFIVHLGWAAFGAGVATAAAQWLSAAAGLILALAAAGPLPAWPTLFDRAALRQILALSGHLVIRTLLLVTAFAVFTNASALFGAARLAANGVILRVLSLASYFVDGAAFAGETLAGMAFGAGDRRELRRVLLLTLAAAIGCATVFLVPALAFPDTVYGLLVDHEDVAALAADSNVWLLPVLLFAALAYAFDGFFLGLTRGRLLSRAMAVSLGVGFAPLAWAAVHFRDPDLLWLSMAGLMAARAGTLGYAARRYLVPDRGGA
ncbi:MAG: MATE family efflux transporter [Holophagales bacterium]|nr:MATE family efflux transporter [Holophagales bacterium]MYG31978.1 MATE family efflux transporter [Holophagales bacterium]MYI79049.1 MATE family efflux transporter [Holophagales bacterium]